MKDLAEKEIAIVLHTLGLAGGGVESYRNHFVAGPGHHDLLELESLVSKGVMVENASPSFLGSRSLVFSVCPEWVIVAEGYARKMKAEAKLTRSQRRYRRYLESDGVFNSFRDFLRYESIIQRKGGAH